MALGPTQQQAQGGCTEDDGEQDEPESPAAELEEQRRLLSCGHSLVGSRFRPGASLRQQWLRGARTGSCSPSSGDGVEPAIAWPSRSVG
ncbi:MAG TPA: hypothetical protein VHQ68_02460, partial [Propionibacteriaceae bacterium]|nr:hypothetical protein [Propionibacteriaceae bacterium]